MIIKALASAIYNDVITGLRGYNANQTMSLQQLEDDVVDERLSIIKEYYLKGISISDDLLVQIPNIQLDTKKLDTTNTIGNDIPHFEIPQIINDLGANAIAYVGATDGSISFDVYTDNNYLQHKYKKVGASRPYVYVKPYSNQNGNLDCYVFNAPFIQIVNIALIPKDPRQLEYFGITDDDSSEFNSINSEIKRRVTEKKIKYYRQLMNQYLPNNQVPR